MENKKAKKDLIIHEYSTEIEISSDDEAFAYYNLAKKSLNNDNLKEHDHYLNLVRDSLISNPNQEIKDELKR